MSDVEINQVQPNTVSYWEERTINIGDYESRKFGLSITKKTTYINKIDKKVSLKEVESVKVYPNQNIDEAVVEVIGKVQKKLDDEEFRIRSAVNGYLNGDHSNLFKVKDLLGVEMNDIDAEISKVEEEKPKKLRPQPKDEFDDVDFDLGTDDDFEEQVDTKKSRNKLTTKVVK